MKPKTFLIGALALVAVAATIVAVGGLARRDVQGFHRRLIEECGVVGVGAPVQPTILLWDGIEFGGQHLVVLRYRAPMPDGVREASYLWMLRPWRTIAVRMVRITAP